MAALERQHMHRVYIKILTFYTVGDYRAFCPSFLRVCDSFLEQINVYMPGFFEDES